MIIEAPVIESESIQFESKVRMFLIRVDLISEIYDGYLPFRILVGGMELGWSLPKDISIIFFYKKFYTLATRNVVSSWRHKHENFKKFIENFLYVCLVIHIYIHREEDQHQLDDLGSTCKCQPRIRMINNGNMLCIHSPLTANTLEIDDELIDDILEQDDLDDGDNIRVQDV